MKRNKLYVLPLLIAVLSLGFAQTTFAAPTAAGTVISNQASVSYQVSSLPKTETSTTTDFTVDSKIDLTVANATAAAVSVLPASSGAAEPHAPMKFTITNTGNEILDMTLLVEEFANTTALFGEADNDNNDSSYQIFVDNNADNTTYVALDDTATTITDLPVDDGITTNHVAVVWVIPNFDDTTIDLDTAVIALQATVTGYGAASDTPITTGAPGEDAKDSVMNDIDGPATTDLAGDAKHSDDGVFKATVGAVTTTKSISGAPASGFYIPGETVEYTLSLANTWGVDATSVVITDDIDDRVALVCGSIAQTVGAPDGFSVTFDTIADADGLYNNGCTGASDDTVQAFQISITGGIAQSATKAFTFEVIIE